MFLLHTSREHYNLYYKLILIIMSFIFLTVTGCQSLKPDLLKSPFPDTEDFKVLIITTADINPNLNNRSSPIKLDFFELTDATTFKKYRYTEIINEQKELSEQLIAKTEKVIPPDSIKEFTIKVNKKTKYLGVIAGFLDINNSTWRRVLYKQKNPYLLNDFKYINLKITDSKIIQLDKEQMKQALLVYKENHPDNDNIDEYGRYKKKKKKIDFDSSKGIFREQI